MTAAGRRTHRDVRRRTQGDPEVAWRFDGSKDNFPRRRGDLSCGDGHTVGDVREEERSMGFKQREKKRTKKAAIAAAQLRARSSGSSASKWWLTLVTRDTCCARCAGILRSGREMVYRRSPREALCVSCAGDDPSIRFRPSAAWEERRRTPKSRR